MEKPNYVNSSMAHNDAAAGAVLDSPTSQALPVPDVPNSESLDHDDSSLLLPESRADAANITSSENADNHNSLDNVPGANNEKPGMPTNITPTPSPVLEPKSISTSKLSQNSTRTELKVTPTPEIIRPSPSGNTTKATGAVTSQSTLKSSTTGVPKTSTTTHSSMPRSGNGMEKSHSGAKDAVTLIRDTVTDTTYTTDNATSAGIAVPQGGGSKTAAIVVPIVLGFVIVAVVIVVVLLVYRAKRRHRKKNIMKYKRYSQNGEISLPLTAISNDNYRSSQVSAHEEAVVYAQVDKTIRPPRPTYKYKSVIEEDTPHNHYNMWNTFPRKKTGGGDDLDTVLVDNANYEATPIKADAPKLPKRTSSSELLRRIPSTPKLRMPGSPKKTARTPSSPRREISWPIPKDTPGSPNGVIRTSHGVCNDVAPPIPQSPDYGPPANRPIPPSPGPPSAASLASRPVPPVPPSPSSCHGLPDGHDYDPVYVPTSDAIAMSRKLDDAGYVTSRRMRLNALGLQAYEDVAIPAASPSPHQQLRSQSSTTPSVDFPAVEQPTRKASEGDTVDGHDTSCSGDRSFDTLGTEDNNNVNFSIEDISKICDNNNDINADQITDDQDVEYCDIPDENDSHALPNGVANNINNTDNTPCSEDEMYETVDFE